MSKEEVPTGGTGEGGAKSESGTDSEISRPKEGQTNPGLGSGEGNKESEKNVDSKQGATAKKRSKPTGPVGDTLIGQGDGTMSNDKLKLKAATPGTWGNNLSVKVDHEGITDEVAKRYNLTKDDLFNLVVFENGVQKERFQNISVKEGPRRIDRVLEEESMLIRTQDALPEKSPLDTTGPTALQQEGKDSDPLDAKDYTGNAAGKEGLYALEKADLFNILCIPPDRREGDTPLEVYQDAMAYCVKRRAFLIVDPPTDWGKIKETAAAKVKDGFSSLGLSGDYARNAAIYFPRVLQSDPLREGQIDIFVPCGIIAGVMSRTDTNRGVWKAPAGLDASLNGIQGLQVNLNDAENGMLNPLGINCLRSFPVTGRVIWGARTLRGADQLADEYKYIPIRRLALYVEESLYQGTKWVVFEPNDEPLWAQIRLNIGSFMHSLFRQGAFQGTTPNEAYFVKCDKETTTQDDRNKGIVNILVGFAPLKPAEFVVIKLQQMAGQIQT